ncbi:LacI family DNA-binding transcriptional regulator [Actinocorallia sp. A-T 12471]|uniref:LacI family DNA-binding transcriptional regulator n=1 Tax=Actinocorallia sp. A-T 12471 TaxID=3089813 RepID=UPI0029CCE4FE|nr:LacI family DNA-binding transcriptional regulator [Actinocorallia sp. A-T 12471]MDX6744258.1 LacI family DNA-binding transcriptional regulator [Actinocorallia sp. A-T 12471]
MAGVTIKDVAAAAGVGVATVSRVMSGTGSVSAATRERVQAVAASMGYRPSALGRGLKTQRTGGIGLIIPDAADPFCAEFVAGVLDTARSENCHVLLDAAGEDPALEAEIVDRFAQQRVDGVIAMPVLGDAAIWQALARIDVAVVFAGRIPPGLTGMPAVLADEAGGVRTAVDYLTGLGHRRIAHLDGDATLGGARERREAFRATLEEHGLAPDEGLLVRARPSADAAYAAAAGLFQSRPDLTAIVAGGHRLGEAAILAARELNLRIPADVSIIVVDDVPWAELCDPPLTVVTRPARAMGERACELVLRAPARRPGRPVVLPTELMVRASCGPVTPSARPGRSR